MMVSFAAGLAIFAVGMVVGFTICIVALAILARDDAEEDFWDGND